MFVVDPPGPPGIHGLGGRVGENWFVFAPLPTADNGPITEQRIGVTFERLVENAAKQFGPESGSVHKKIGSNALAAVADERRDAFATQFRFDGRIGYFDADLATPIFQPTDERRVLNVKRVIIMELWQPIRAARKNFVVEHESGRGSQPGKLI